MKTGRREFQNLEWLWLKERERKKQNKLRIKLGTGRSSKSYNGRITAYGSVCRSEWTNDSVSEIEMASCLVWAKFRKMAKRGGRMG